jgi:hypothetical protein
MIWLVQLVFDCRDPDPVMQFWGCALGYRNDLIGLTPEAVRKFRAANPQFDGLGRIDDRELRRMPVYIQRVPEPKAGRNRVRLEISASPDDLAATTGELFRLGATACASVGDLLDPEGNEFSVVPTAAGGERRLRTIIFDALDPERLLGFWSAATGYAVSGNRCDPPPSRFSFEDGGFVVGGRRYGHITGMDAAPAGGPLFDLVPGMACVPADGPKQSKNRLHVDLNSTDVAADLERLRGLGATVLCWDDEHVLADPEGNEFCLSGRPPVA